MNNKIKKKLFWIFLVFIMFIGNMSIFSFTITGSVHDENTGWIPYGATVHIREVDPIPGGSYVVESESLGSAVISETGDFTISFPWPSAGAGFEIGNPDLIFFITQDIDGDSASYQEQVSDTRWNITDGSTVDLIINSDELVFSNPDVTLDDIPNDDVFLFTRIGKYDTDVIDCMGSDALSSGYYLARRAPYSNTGIDSDIAFGSTLDLFGWIGKYADISYYKVQYSTNNGSTWNDVNTSLPNKWYDTSDPNPLYWHWESQTMGPFSVDGIDNLYTVPFFVRPDTPWSYLDRIARLNTNLISNGKIKVRIVGYKDSGSGLTEAGFSDLVIAPNHGEIYLKVDNTRPTARIMQVKLNGTSKDTCEIINFGPGDELSIIFRVWDQLGHLRSYNLKAMYGHDEIVASPPAGSSQNYGSIVPGPSWQGYSTKTVTYNGSDYNSSEMPTCAYQFRLNAHKRVTNGYHLIYGDEDTWHVTIQR